MTRRSRSSFADRCRDAADAVRAYTAGVGSRDLERMFRRDATEAYQVLTRGRPAVPEGARGVKAFLRRSRLFFLGLSYTLSPPRRLLFALALLLAAADACNLDISSRGAVDLGVDIGPAFYAVLALVFLLALELVDRVRVRDELEVARELLVEERSVTLSPGDLLLLYSDGLPEEVHPTSGEAFGFERLRELLAPGGGASEVHDRVLAAFDAFLAGEGQRDDISLVVVEREAHPEVGPG